jgi:hypothetical protein
MTVVHNHTGVPHFWFEQSGPEGERLDVLAVRATFDFPSHSGAMTLAREQEPISYGDAYSGPIETDPLRCVVVQDGDLVPYKPGTDVLFTGHAHSPGGVARSSWLAQISVGPIKKSLKVHGPRTLHKRMFGWNLTQGEAVVKVALDYRSSYGGCLAIPGSLTANGESDVINFSGNPAGCGWLPKLEDYRHLPKAARQYVKRWIDAHQVITAPQFEPEGAPLKHPCAGMVTAGLGPIARWWEPRISKQGKLDAVWREQRFPLLPVDFDSRYFQSAPSDLIAAPHLAGDEVVTLSGLLPQRTEMTLPGWCVLCVATRESGLCDTVRLVLDTLRFNLDSRQASFVWRANFDFDDPVTEIALSAVDIRASNVHSPAIRVLDEVDNK